MKRLRCVLARSALVASMVMFVVLMILWGLSLRYEPVWWFDDGKGNETVIVGLYGGHCTIRWTKLDQIFQGQFYLKPDMSNAPSGWVWPIRFYISRRQEYVLFPIWIGLPIAGFYPFMKLRNFQRNQMRFKHGLCLHCGYDLQASTVSCPECGHETHPDQT